MGLASQLGYEHRDPVALHRGVQRLAMSRPGSWALARTSPRLDRWAFRVSDGSWTFTSALSALPVLLLRTTGARTGLDRETPLVAIPHDDDLAIIGSGYGQRATPGWVHNLRARPTAVVMYRATETDVVATAAEDADAIWERAAATYPGFGVYPERAAHRAIAVFVLRAAP